MSSGKDDDGDSSDLMLPVVDEDPAAMLLSPLGEHTNIGARYRDELLARFPADGQCACM